MNEVAPENAPAARSWLLAYLQLMRAPNVFTALADVMMGFFVTQSAPYPWLALVLLATTSACLYLAGMVLNDVYDFGIDLRERPQRPLPSGRVSRAFAWRLGYGLLGIGIVVGCLAGWLMSPSEGWGWRSGLLALLLAGCVLLYDAVLKTTWAGPPVMGSCRLLNVLLGMSLSVVPMVDNPVWQLGFTPLEWAIAGGIGIYITGVTIFARSEAERSGRALLAAGLAVMAAGIVLLGAAPRWAPDWQQFQLESQWIWPATLALLTVTIFRRGLVALADPSPSRVQSAVKQCILSLIVLDAAVCLLLAPWPAAVAVLALLLPTVVVGKWVYST